MSAPEPTPFAVVVPYSGSVNHVFDHLQICDVTVASARTSDDVGFLIATAALINARLSAAVQRERQAAAASALREAAASLRITADVVGEEKHRMSREAETYRYAAKMIDERAERADKETT